MATGGRKHYRAAQREIHHQEFVHDFDKFCNAGKIKNLAIAVGVVGALVFFTKGFILGALSVKSGYIK